MALYSISETIQKIETHQRLQVNKLYGTCFQNNFLLHIHLMLYPVWLCGLEFAVILTFTKNTCCCTTICLCIYLSNLFSLFRQLAAHLLENTELPFANCKLQLVFVKFHVWSTVVSFSNLKIGTFWTHFDGLLRILLSYVTALTVMKEISFAEPQSHATIKHLLLPGGIFM